MSPAGSCVPRCNATSTNTGNNLPRLRKASLI
jgi:hypothetical protein